jgi:hypothetical protein
LSRGFGYDDSTPGMAADLFALDEYRVYQQLAFREVCRMEHFYWSGLASRGGMIP